MIESGIVITIVIVYALLLCLYKYVYKTRSTDAKIYA